MECDFHCTGAANELAGKTKRETYRSRSTLLLFTVTSQGTAKGSFISTAAVSFSNQRMSTGPSSPGDREHINNV